MIFFEKQFDVLSKKIQSKVKQLKARFKAYLKRLLFPLYLFPIKIFTYSAYYVGEFSFLFTVALIKILIDTIIYPFRSLKNFLKSMFILGVMVYMVASLFVIADYLRTQYGWYGKFFCAIGVRDEVQNKVVRVVGGYSEGTGFFIAPNQIITNFHVIADEPSPKIIFPDGKFVTPTKIIGDQEVDLAVLFTEDHFPNLVMPLPEKLELKADEPLIAAGYPLGTDLTGDATLLKGRFVDIRESSQMPIAYIQTDISLVEGMSGGPLIDQCGQVVGINTLSMAGLSLFVNGVTAEEIVPSFTDQNITKIEVDPSASPEKAVEAFYVYLKARRMEDGYALLSDEYLTKTNFEEWTNRFTDILDVNVILVQPDEYASDTVFIKFSTKNWNNGEANYHYYEGTWQTVEEDGVYKMRKSKIQEVDDPDWEWFYE
ncbi:hypothetical protein A2382_01060 [Candidatus Woesebacteria bacterium RIFOXYB1_FULL_38_16]|uniref:Serine protease n=1 Tax=Candidatus Woesebacteria bacterium RIFOXYB1_FULL_38_16 TaxID=1802538 RepID=A0A1F8CUS2_9BACT|nr:MAG: hypothetical protein A2382_01060 [Candidatus Woesebacteria bacterium RIFOXYB1_FULL_38_16]